jgi:curli biogenesis system outer membrane secretion channel CsgG
MIKDISLYNGIVRFVNVDRQGFTASVALNEVDVINIVEVLYYDAGRNLNSVEKVIREQISTMDVAEVRNLVGHLARMLNS